MQIKNQLTFIETLKLRMDASEQEQASQLVAAGNALIEENQKGIIEANIATLSAQKVIIANSQLIPTNSQWIILVGSDTTLESAEHEVTQATKKGLANVKLFKKRGVFRTALVYPNRQEAADALADAKAGTRSDAYMVSLEKWCPNQSDATSDVVDCSE